jgi:hypothetical protein
VFRFSLTVLGLWLAAVPLWAQSPPDDRRHDWSAAGLTGRPPALVGERDALAFGAVADGLTDDAPAIQAALDDLGGQPGMVYLPPGTYRLEQPLDLPGGAVLRGAGAEHTRLEADFGGAPLDVIRIGTDAAGPDRALARPPAFGERFAVLAPGQAAADLQPGIWVELVQDNGAWDTEPAPWAGESLGHIARLEARQGDTLRLSTPVPVAFDSTGHPRVRALSPTRHAGVECLTVERLDEASSGSNLRFYLAVDAWAYGVASVRSNGAHLLAARSAHLHVSGCSFAEAWQYDGAGTRGYGVALVRHTVHALVEDNVLRRLRHALIVKQGAAGNVFAHNYAFDAHRSEFPQDASGDISLHGHWPGANLFEGNDVENVITDGYWGPSAPGNTFFRNRVRRYGILLTATGTNAQTYVGNDVIGTGLLLGQYALLGSGHWEDGNRVGSGIVPTGSALVGEASLMRDAPPSWWPSAEPWPATGFGRTGVLPARTRYDAGHPTACRTARGRVRTVREFPAPVAPSPLRAAAPERWYVLDPLGRVLEHGSGEPAFGRTAPPGTFLWIDGRLHAPPPR